MRVTVIVPVFNSSKIFRYCLEALRSSHFRDFEIIVVDDCSSDDSVRIAEGFDCRVIRLPRRLGSAAARNKGAQAAKGSYLIFIDSDVVCDPQTLGQVVKVLEEGWDACIGIYNVVPIFHGIDSLPRGNFFSIYKNIFIWVYHGLSSGQIDWFWTACGGVKKEVFYKLGGFSNFFCWKSVEDIDFGYRMTKNNYKIFLDRNITVTHLHHFSFAAILRNDFQKSRDWTYLNLMSNCALFLKHPVAQFKWRGTGMAGSLFFAFFLIFSIVTFKVFFVAVFIFFMFPFLERRFFSSLLRYGGRNVFIRAWLFKPIDDIIIGVGVFAGTLRVLFRR